ncbi:MAG: DUF177 domain-containing protein [Chloroflexota bacterium]
MSNPRRPLRLNVGFVLHQEVGYTHEFSFDLPQLKMGEDLELRQLVGTLTIGRTAQGLLFTGEFKAETGLACVRCLKPFDQELAWTLTEHYASSEKSVSDSGLIVPEDAQIDVQPLLREYALLELPINPLCRADCKGLCAVCGQDLNLRDCGHRPDAGASPFAALEDFLKQ